MSTIRPFLIVGGMLWAAVALAGAKAADIVGVGAQSCETWIETQGSDRSIQSAWLAGYLSSYRFHNGDIYMPDADARDKWVSNYCLKHPIDNVWTAANRLIDELSRRASGFEW